MLDRRTFVLGCALAAGFGSGDAGAIAADAPILSLRGPQGEVLSEQSLASLDTLPQSKFKTSTPWHKGVVEFSGTALSAYFEAAHVSPRKIRLVALNDYVVDAEVSDLLAGDALLATRQNGVPLPISDKGPVFLIFPFDARSELQHQSYYSRAVWQLTEIDIVE
ncbi:hypothetical protein BJF93_13655 [Xaviernesmea oryzae]|uniref:Oxidoreductase molybdopterin-binding domain-containing protein n=1 Tax=Xaviernesmea oryzae TaxID=464029 RepID=A0A1Q9AR38_9HYPH|nr:molybdopterin-dependent oxidoreductase [Xaviernesmea oryzae]OLP57884.1 hypothetical protein BJF93_13655 [Xaviernesmea oryzae]